MSEEFVLEATRREVVGKQVKGLRREGNLPAIVYGYGLEPTPITLDLRSATKLLRDVGASTLVSLKVDDDKYNVLVREMQSDVLSRKLLHVDFQALAMDVAVRTQLAIVLVGEDIPVVKNYNAILTTGVESLEIECLPKDLPEHIEVDVTALTTIGDSITVADLVPPAGVTILDAPDTMIVVATAPENYEAAETEAEAVETGAAEPEVIEKGKLEDEEA